MDEQVGMRQRLQLWHDTGAPQPLSELLDLLLAWLPVPPQLARALGNARAEDLRMEVIETLLSDKGAALLRVRNPRPFARTALANRFRDALREQASKQLPSSVSNEVLGRSHARPEPDAETRFAHEERVHAIVQALRSLSLEERVSLLLLYMPRHLAESDWSVVASRHAIPPAQPPAPLEREQIAALLFPDDVPRKTYERVTKLIRRTEKKLRASLAELDALPGEEES